MYRNSIIVTLVIFLVIGSALCLLMVAAAAVGVYVFIHSLPPGYMWDMLRWFNPVEGV